MEQVTDVVGNATALLIERIFWLSLGCFFCLAIITSFIKSNKNVKIKHSSEKELKNLVKKAMKQNDDLNNF